MIGPPLEGDRASIMMIYHNYHHYCSQVKISLSVDSCRVDTRALPRWLPHRGGWLPSLGDSSSTAMAVRLVSVLHFYPLFSCEEIPFVFAKHVRFWQCDGDDSGYVMVV